MIIVSVLFVPFLRNRISFPAPILLCPSPSVHNLSASDMSCQFSAFRSHPSYNSPFLWFISSLSLFVTCPLLILVVPVPIHFDFRLCAYYLSRFISHNLHHSTSPSASSLPVVAVVIVPSPLSASVSRHPLAVVSFHLHLSLLIVCISRALFRFCLPPNRSQTSPSSFRTINCWPCVALVHHLSPSLLFA